MNEVSNQNIFHADWTFLPGTEESCEGATGEVDNRSHNQIPHLIKQYHPQVSVERKRVPQLISKFKSPLFSYKPVQLLCSEHETSLKACTL